MKIRNIDYCNDIKDGFGYGCCMNYKRNYRVDFIRVICIFWVVCVAHMDEYAQIDLSSPIIITCTKIILSVLFYISGWCCRQKEYNSRNEIAVFFKKRLIRIYPLYFFALVAMVVVSYLFGYDYATGRSRIIAGILLVGGFTSPPIAALYFVNILMFFYVITPMLKYNSKKKAIISLSIIIFVLILLRRNWIFKIDYRIIYYLPVYFFGLNSNLFNGENIYKKKKKLLDYVTYILAVVAFCGYAVLLECNEFMFKWLFEIVALWLLSISSLIILNPAKDLQKVKYRKQIELLSYSSFCLYLFHRQVFSVLCYYFGKLNPFFAYIIVCPLVVIIAFFIQKIYDEIILFIRRNGARYYSRLRN